MLALYLLASHLVGDYLLQTRWQANRKLDDFAYRVRHVTAYSFAFVPVVALSGVPFGRMCEFVVALFLLHLATDSRRFRPAPCLHGESSIRGELRHGRFVVTAGPHRTGCTPGTR